MPVANPVASLFGAGGLPGFSSSANSSAGAAGAGGSWNLGTGPWTVNQAGSGGAATQLPALSLPMLIAIGVVAWLVLKR